VGADFEKTKVYVDERSFQTKPLVDCIRESIYEAYAIDFCGVWYEEKWFISDSLEFFGEKMNEETSKAYLSEYDDSPNRWEIGNFEVGWYVRMPGTDLPIRDVEREEFPGTPLLVSQIKIERKTDVNRAYEAYINESLVRPFLEQLRISNFEEYAEFSPLFWNHTLLYPASKAFFLVVTMARHQMLGWRLVWFFYDTTMAKFYRWTYPQPRYNESHYWYGEEVIMDIGAISGWNDHAFLNSSRTLDDPAFWSGYVLKRVDGRYRWLEEV
jgi:hypothetical protein